MQTGSIVAVCAIVPILAIASTILICSTWYRRRASKAENVEAGATSRSIKRSRQDIATRPLSNLSLETTPDAGPAWNDKSLECLPAPSLWNATAKKSSEEKPTSIPQSEARDMRQMIANGQIGTPKGAEIRRPPPAADWSDLVSWDQIRAPRRVVPDGVRMTHYAM